MKAKDYLLPVLIVLLTTAFLIVSFGVYLTKGKSAYWIAKKMRIGGILLSFSFVLNSCEPKEEVSCYSPVIPNDIFFDNMEYADGIYESITINIDSTNQVTGHINSPNVSDYSFSITDTLFANTFQKGDIIPTDGKFDGQKETFYIELDNQLETNKYYVNVFKGTSDDQDQNEILRTYALNIYNED